MSLGLVLASCQSPGVGTSSDGGATDAGARADAGAGRDGGGRVDAGPMVAPHTETITFQDGVAPVPTYAGTRDTTLLEAIPTSAQGTSRTIYASGAINDVQGQGKVALVKWDIGVIAPGAHIDAASLDFYMTDEPVVTNGIPVRAVTTPWSESQATWTHALTDTLWATNGARGDADRDNDVSLGDLAPTAPGDYSLDLDANGIARVQDWVDHPEHNQGVTIDPAADSEAIAFSSREALIPSARPALTVTFTTTAPPYDGGYFDAGNPDEPVDGGPAADIPTPIKYIVVFIKENHTFDNYFEGFPGATTSATAKMSNGTVINRPKAPNGKLPRDICHAHACATKAFHGGAMDQFDKVTHANDNNDHLTYIHYTESQIPNYWKYARNFVLADHFFSSTLAQSFPGHFATVAGFNVALGNPGCMCGDTCTVPVFNPTTCKITNAKPCWDAPSLVTNLPHGFTWAEYGVHALMRIKGVAALPNIGSHERNNAAITRDLTTGTQPNLMFAHLTGGTSEHPPQAVCPGENQTVKLINDIMKGPHWKETAILLLWDDWGGFYDSVKPAAAKCPNGDYVHPGFRIPLLVISPYAKKGYVLKTPTEQISVVRLIEDLWGLPRMHPLDARIRDSQVGSLMGAFDFSQTPRDPMLLQTRTCP